jgi:hypothetical protein
MLLMLHVQASFIKGVVSIKKHWKKPGSVQCHIVHWNKYWHYNNLFYVVL